LAEAIAQATRPHVQMGRDWVGLCWMSRETASGRVVCHNGGTGSAWAFVAAGPSVAVTASAGAKPDPRLDAAIWSATFEVA